MEIRYTTIHQKIFFVIKNADGTPRIMFKPEKELEDWNAQK